MLDQADHEQLAPPPMEIEVKYRLGNDLVELEQALRIRGCELSEPLHQDDQAYAESQWTYDKSKINVAFARLRTQRGKHLFTVKRPTLNEMACIEFETEVADRHQMHGALIQMGFYPTVRIVKSRRIGQVAGVSVCVDDVDGLGVFVEFETASNSVEQAEMAQRELDVLARSLGLQLDRVMDTYDSLIRSELVSA